MNCDILKILDKENLYLLGLPRARKFIKTNFKKHTTSPGTSSFMGTNYPRGHIPQHRSITPGSETKQSRIIYIASSNPKMLILYSSP